MTAWLSMLDAARAAYRAARDVIRGTQTAGELTPPPPPPAPEQKPDEPAKLATTLDQRLNRLEARELDVAATCVTPIDGDWRATQRDVGGGIGSGSGEDKLRSFAFTLDGGPSVTIAKGNVHYSGRGTYLAAETGVTIAGTAGTPTHVYVRLNKSGTPAAEIVTAASPVIENDTWWYFLLYTFYLDGGNNAVKDFDWRYDIRIGSPIGP